MCPTILRVCLIQDAVREAKYQEQWARHNIKVMGKNLPVFNVNTTVYLIKYAGTCAFFCAVMWVLQSKNADPRDKKCVFPVINSVRDLRHDTLR